MTLEEIFTGSSEPPFFFDSPTSTLSGTTINSSFHPSMLDIPTDNLSFNGNVTGISSTLLRSHKAFSDNGPLALGYSSPSNMSDLFNVPCFWDLHNSSSVGVLRVPDTHLPPSAPSYDTNIAPINLHPHSSPPSSLSPLDLIHSNSAAERVLSERPCPDHNGTRRVRCLVAECNRCFTNKYTLKLHMESHKAKPRVRFPCTLGCSECFSRSHDRLRHEVTQHGKVCEFVCDECMRFFSSRKTLENHQCPTARGRTRWAK